MVLLSRSSISPVATASEGSSGAKDLIHYPLTAGIVDEN